MSEENAEAAEAMQTDTAEKENVSENASTLRKARKNKLGLLTRRMNIIKDLMNDKSNVKEVNENCVTFGELLKALEAIHKEYQNTLSEEDCKLDDNTWYKPKRAWCVCVCPCMFMRTPYLSVWFMGVHKSYNMSLSDQYCLRVSQPGHSQLLILDQHCHTCSATSQTLTTNKHIFN